MNICIEFIQVCFGLESIKGHVVA